jgi:hypothetical protein
VYADITLESVALDTPNNVAVVITDAPAKRAQTRCPLSKSDKCYIFRFFYAYNLLGAITNALTRTLQSVNKGKNNIQHCKLKLFQCSQHKSYFSISLTFPLFYPSLPLPRIFKLWM